MSLDDSSISEQRVSRRKLLETGAASGVGLWLASGGGAAYAAASRKLGAAGAAAARGTVNVYCSAGQRWELPQRAELGLFKKKFPGIKVNLRPLPHSEAVTKVQVTMASHTSSFDVVFTDYGQWPALAKLGAMTDLKPYMDRDPAWRDDYLKDVPTAINKLYRNPATPKGKLYGLTPDGNAQIVFYRQDLFQKAGIKVPETWPQAIEAAKALTDTKSNQYGFITTARRGGFAGWSFWAIMASYGGHWFDKEAPGGWHPTFSTDAGFKALDTLKKLMAYAHPVTLNATDDEANKALADGSAVYAPIEWGTSVLNNKDFTKFYDVIGADLPPRGETKAGLHRPLMGGLGMMIPTWSKNKDAAWEWIKWCNSGDKTSPAIGKAWVTGSGQPARVSLLKKYTKIRPYYAGLAKAYPHAVSFVSIIPEAFTISDVIGNEATEVITGGKDIDAALKAMDKGVTQIMSDAGYYK
jgi:sorbitol/mannitol transport system substrate-binding protein